LRALYPSLEILEAPGGPREVGADPALQARHEQYILALLAGRRVTHFYSSEFYGDHVSRALGAVDRRVDPERRQFPISGTAIRANPYEHRAMLSPRVYADLVENVVLLGGPSTGKTTLC